MANKFFNATSGSEFRIFELAKMNGEMKILEGDHCKHIFSNLGGQSSNFLKP